MYLCWIQENDLCETASVAVIQIREEWYKTNIEEHTSILQAQDVLLKLYAMIKGSPTDEYVLDLKAVLVDKNDNSSDSEDDDRGSNEQWESSVENQLRVYRLLERNLLRDLLIKEEQMRLS